MNKQEFAQYLKDLGYVEAGLRMMEDRKCKSTLEDELRVQTFVIYKSDVDTQELRNEKTRKKLCSASWQEIGRAILIEHFVQWLAHENNSQPNEVVCWTQPKFVAHKRTGHFGRGDGYVKLTIQYKIFFADELRSMAQKKELVSATIKGDGHGA